MKIAVIKKSKNGLIIKIDNSEYSEVPFAVWEKYRLYNDSEIDDSLLKKVLYDAEYFKAKSYILRLLAKHSYFENELKKKLILKKYCNEIVLPLLKEIKNLGFINDEKYAGDFIEHKIKIRKYGLIRIGNELRRKGVSKIIIDNLLRMDEDDEQIKINIHFLAQKKLNSLMKKEDDKRKISQKIYSHLVLKGYSSELIMEELKKLRFNIYEEI